LSISLYSFYPFSLILGFLLSIGDDISMRLIDQAIDEFEQCKTSTDQLTTLLIDL
jgi:hypothetical protein